MKKYCILFGLILVSMSSLIAQKRMNSAVIDYTVEVKSPEASAQMFAMGAAVKVAFEADKVYFKATGMGGALGLDFKSPKENTGLLLLDMMGQRKAIPMDSKDLSNAQKEEKKIDFSKLKKLGKTKVIQGYTCEKYFYKNTEDNIACLVYLTDKIDVSKHVVLGKLMGGLDGYPLGIVIKNGENSVAIMASKISSTIPSSLFEMEIPEGYEKTTLEDLKKEMQGMQAPVKTN